MNVLVTMGLLVGGVILVVAALLKVLRDLIVRGPFEAPLLEDEGSRWPRHSRGTGTVELDPLSVEGKERGRPVTESASRRAASRQTSA